MQIGFWPASRRTQTGAPALPPHGQNLSVVDPVRVTLADLVRLAPLARQLELWREKEVESGGSHHTVFKGRGMEFAETRPYQPGDDIRHIDWRVTARSGRAHTKLFREERERPVVIWIDLRPSMFFATRGVFKSVLAARLAAMIAWIANAHGDRVGGRVLTAYNDIVLNVARGRPAVLRMLRAIEKSFSGAAIATPAPEQVSPTESLRSLANTIRPGSCVFLLSDFQSIEDASVELLRSIGVHCDITLCHIHDLLESNLPPPGIYPISSPTGQTAILNSAVTGLRQTYQQRFAARVEHLRSETRNHHARYLSISTSDDPITVLCGAGNHIRPKSHR
ncbi:MAG: DUF58 domain-containing protein [Gammaproteobacteria bacterium]